jgi:hypothetical protein
MGNKEGHPVIWQRTPINIISSICFHLSGVENGKDDSSSEAHLKVLIWTKELSNDPVPLKGAQLTFSHKQSYTKITNTLKILSADIHNEPYNDIL